MFDEKDKINGENIENENIEPSGVTEEDFEIELFDTDWVDTDENADREVSESYEDSAEKEFSSDFEPDVYVPEKKKKKGFMKTVLVTGLCACVGGAVFAATSFGVDYFLKKTITKTELATTQEALAQNPTGEPVQLSYPEGEVNGEASIEQIAQACLPSVVSITNKGVSEVVTFFGNYQTESISSGSGIIIGENDDELLIVTNYHVVAGSKELTVVFSHDDAAVQSGETTGINIAHIKGYDANKDIAVIAVKLSELSEETKGKIRVATIGNSDEIALGSGVVAIGNALGYGQSVTHGIVSAVDREVTMEGVDGGIITNEYIQTDAAINSGNSGGALLNMKGELIGINSAKIAGSGVEGMGYAIPISDVEELIGDLMTMKTREIIDEEKRGYLGIYGTDVTVAASEAYGMPVGVFVQENIENSPADKSDLEPGDIIVKLDDVTVTDMTSLQTRLSYYSAGETVVLTVKRPDGRSYKEMEIEVTLGSKKDAGIEE